MADSMIPEDVKILLRDCIESFEQLEVLLLLHRRRGDTWTQDSLASELNGMVFDIVANVLDHLRRWNLVEVESGAFRYKPGNTSLEATIHALAEAYDEHRLEIMKLMNRNAIERVRTSAMRAFADAFFVGGEGKKKDG